MTATATAPRRRTRTAAPVAPLGSLTQVRGARTCHSCGSAQVTRLAMTLTDGTPVDFTSCRGCEARRWEHDGVALSVQDVLGRTRKPA